MMTLKSQSTDLTKAEGTKVKDIPSDLPKVTNAADGKPSIDMNGYKDSDKLVVQPLIEGDGREARLEQLRGGQIHRAGCLTASSSTRRGTAIRPST